jgi:hypothetical protein
MPKRAAPKKAAATARIRMIDRHAHALRRQHPSWTWADALRAAGAQYRAGGH